MDANLEEKDFDIREIYTPLSVAKEEVWRRWNDKKLRKKVEDFLGGDIPDFLREGPKAILTRQITSPNKEFFHFLDMASLLELNPLGWEFTEDLFITTNRDKANLGRIALFHGLNRKSQFVLSYKKIIDLTGKEEKKRLRDVRTFYGCNLVEFHHKLLKKAVSGIDLYDASDWYKSNGKSAKEYYPRLLALFVANGVLFENFNLDRFESRFTKNVVFPAFKEVLNYFGLAPLIVRIITEEDASNFTLCCYRKSLFESLALKYKNQI